MFYHCLNYRVTICFQRVQKRVQKGAFLEKKKLSNYYRKLVKVHLKLKGFYIQKKSI